MRDDGLQVQPPASEVVRATLSQPPAAMPAPARRLRLWPACVVVAALWLAITLPGWFWPGTQFQINCMVWGAIGGASAVGLWWLVASRAPWTDRALGLLAFAACAVGSFPLFHHSLTYRLYGPIVRGLPVATTAWVVWLVLTPRLAWSIRRVGMLAAIALGWGYCTLLRMDGVDGAFTPEVSWRWSPTAEEKFLAERSGHKTAAAEHVAAKMQPGDWPGFRGPNRDSRLVGVHIATDWRQRPPRLLWRQRVGPGWGSFAVVGDMVYTQEQRGQDEAVVCYLARTGAEVWAHTDSERFSETIAGPGPRSTPTFHDGKLFTLGATGKLNCLDPATGSALWSRSIKEDSGVKLPEWGFASSPLIVQDVVTVFAGAPGGKSVLGYRVASGEPAWSAGEGHSSYSSTHRARLDGVEQLLLTTDKGLTAFEPGTGKVLWEDNLPQQQFACIAQPAIVNDTDVVYGKNQYGLRRVRIYHEGDYWQCQQPPAWESKALNPYYNDFVIHGDHLYGIDDSGAMLTCVSLARGKGSWRARGYGHGQVLLLADQGLLLVLSEKGDIALVEADPQRHKELTRFHAIEGKTWNHPVLVRGKLFVRNGEEMACYELPEDVVTKTAAR
ncbi:MAG TPA: PQQ-binding-like beta-propeller repeat protein [Gemmataceae bacterium]|nr:PQQ-binding-like beta-propeller repeat protein [Gemmataceae bacterium]